MRHLDLFSGIGGFALAASWAGYDTVQFVEIDPFCQRVLSKHWPEVPVHDDITTFSTEHLATSWYRHLTDEDWERFDMGAKRKNYDGAAHMYEHGCSIAECADYFGITRQAMWMILKRRGVEMRSHLRNGEANHFYRGGPLASDHAQNILESAMKRGDIERRPCERCGADDVFEDGRRSVQAHHDDYNFPLRVRWLCQPCHHEWHKNNRPIERRKEVMPDEFNGAIDLATGGFP